MAWGEEKRRCNERYRPKYNSAKYKDKTTVSSYLFRRFNVFIVPLILKTVFIFNCK